MELLIAVVAVLIIGSISFLILWRKRGKSKTKETSPAPNSTLADWDTGKTGERYTREVLAPLAGYKRFLSNCYFPKSDGTFTEVDVILLHESGVYVFEVKNYSGWIFGEENQRQWTQTLPSGRGRSKSLRFFNPILQNKVHLKWLQEYIKEPVPLYSYIVFSDRCELKRITLTSKEHTVLNRRNLFYSVRRKAEVMGNKLTVEEVDALYDKLYPLTQVTEEQKAAHVQTVEQKKHPASKAPVLNEMLEIEKRLCPRCGSELVLRTAKRGKQAGSQFWGCSNFPNCRFVEPVDNTPFTMEK